MTEMVSELRHDMAANKATTVTVTARPLKVAPWVGFEMVADYKNKGGKQEGEKLKFDMDAGPFDLTFDLDDKSGLKLAFCDPVADAIWVAVGEDCPTTAGNGAGAIIPGSVGKAKLDVGNANHVPETLTFMLRFTGNAPSGGTTTYLYDPKIVNGGDPPLVGPDK